MTCPAAFHLCPQSAEHAGFSVLDRETGKETAARAEANARQIAERDYPGCKFALSTIANTHPGIELPSNTPDAVIVAILKPLGDRRFGIVAHIVSSVASASCIPFSSKIWADVKDHLPQDHRRLSKRTP